MNIYPPALHLHGQASSDICNGTLMFKRWSSIAQPTYRCSYGRVLRQQRFLTHGLLICVALSTRCRPVGKYLTSFTRCFRSFGWSRIVFTSSDLVFSDKCSILVSSSSLVPFYFVKVEPFAQPRSADDSFLECACLIVYTSPRADHGFFSNK